MTRTLAFPAPAASVAVAYFAAELGFEVDPDDLARDLDAGRTEGYVVVETRAHEAFAQAHIPGAINLPYRDMTPESTAHLDRDLVYVCYCESINCNAATKGALKLAELGFQVKRLSGGITSWIAAGYPVDEVGKTDQASKNDQVGPAGQAGEANQAAQADTADQAGKDQTDQARQAGTGGQVGQTGQAGQASQASAADQAGKTGQVDRADQTGQAGQVAAGIRCAC